MAYRSLKRMIGETSLERKCRLLFGVCFFLLIFAAFWWVENITEGLVKRTSRRVGRDYVDFAMIALHWHVWENGPVYDEQTKEFTKELFPENFHWEFLKLNDSPVVDLSDDPIGIPRDAAEEQILTQLKSELAAQLLESQTSTQAEIDPLTGQPSLKNTLAYMRTQDPKSFMRQDRENNMFHYYQPVYWRNACFGCHENMAGDAFSMASGVQLFDTASPPFRVVKISFPDNETQDAITWNRAILLATGIITIFLAMVMLYVIVRYVIVKPLKHLRDVSEDISRGNTELRAEIRTNDEFEELANAFNRMLRHLTETQSELREVNVTLDAKVDQLAQLNMRLYEMNRLKSDFLANMSHELRTPLNSIIGFSEVLQGLNALNDKQKKYATNIQKSGRLLLDLINDILDLAKIEAGKMDLRPSEFRIDAIIHAQCDMVRPLAEEKNIDLGVEILGDPPLMYQDQSKIQQILINLLSNAIKFTPEGGRITVSGSRDRTGRLMMTVADTGVGIAAEDREVIFEKFRQSANTVGDGNLTREYSGTGLGLSIVKELCKLLGGEISFDSELGKGSTFKVILPWTVSNQRSRVSIEMQVDELAHSQRVDGPKPHLPQPNFTSAAST